MPFVSSRLLPSLLASAGLLATATLAPAAVFADEDARGAVYTMTNATSGNQVVVFRRSGNGELTPAGMVATGGNGSGTGLGSGHGLVTTEHGRYVVAVNAGSNSVSLLRRDSRGLELVGAPAPSGGLRPTSVTVNDDTVYVLNADSNSIAGFRLDRRKGLSPIDGSIQRLGAGTSVPSQIQFDRSGRVLIVDERGSSTIDVRCFPSRRGRTGAYNAIQRGRAVWFRREQARTHPVLSSRAGRRIDEWRHFV